MSSRSAFSKSEPATDSEASLYTFSRSYLPDIIFETVSTPQIVAAFAAGSLSSIGIIALHARYFKRIPTSDWVHPRFLAKRKWIKGIVTSVGDADNFRLYHTPGLFWRWPIKLRNVPNTAKDLRNETIHIRMAGVDAPEASHFGKPAQPYAPEALEWLKNNIEGKRLWVQMIRRDQYGRVVAIPIHPPLLPFLRAPASRCVSIAMLQAGFATTYEQSGAEYGRWGKEEFSRYEAVARKGRRGMWASGTALESPSEYKKRHKIGSEPEPVSQNTNGKDADQRNSGNWLSALRFWR